MLLLPAVITADFAAAITAAGVAPAITFAPVTHTCEDFCAIRIECLASHKEYTIK